MTLHTYILQPMSLLSINFLDLTFFVMDPRQNFKGQGHYSKVKSKSHQVMALHTNNPQPMSLPSINILHFAFSEIKPEQTFCCCLSTHSDVMGENNTCIALTGWEIKRKYKNKNCFQLCEQDKGKIHTYRKFVSCL